MKKIVVVGSINADVVCRMARFPEPGETIFGYEHCIFAGGKGANQAVAAGRLGAAVTFLGKTGADAYADQCVNAMKDAHVNTDRVARESALGTGTAMIQVADSGDNAIVVIPGANNEVDKAYIDSHKQAILDADFVLLQLEIPLKTVIYTAKLAKEAGKTVMLDPAPAQKLPTELLRRVDIITPNEKELMDVTGGRFLSVEEACRYLLEGGVKTVINKVGAKGAYIVSRLGITHIATYKVDAVDTTAAGDSFNAGLAFALSCGKDMADAVAYANAVAALAVTQFGAQTAMPTRHEVDEFLIKQIRNEDVQ